MAKEIHLWTDGSSINNGAEKGVGGHGYVLLYGDFADADITTKYCDDKFTLFDFGSAKIDEITTNQREEMKALIEGLKRIKNYEVPIVIFSDSAYLINCFEEKWYLNWRSNGWKNSSKKPVANKDLWEELLQIIEDNFLKITFSKVKGHSKVYYNEQCDKLAGQGMEKIRAIRRGEE